MFRARTLLLNDLMSKITSNAYLRGKGVLGFRLCIWCGQNLVWTKKETRTTVIDAFVGYRAQTSSASLPTYPRFHYVCKIFPCSFRRAHER